MAAEKDKTKGMKSAYELALERLAGEGIAPPSETTLDAATREKMAEVRRKTEAKLAELEILYRDRRKKIAEREELLKAEEEYAAERRRLEERRDREIEKLRGGASTT